MIFAFTLAAPVRVGRHSPMWGTAIDSRPFAEGELYADPCKGRCSSCLLEPPTIPESRGGGLAMPTEGELIKGMSHPEVYVIQNGQRHWIPDPATLQSRWSWDQVQTLSDGDVDVIPLGDPIPSVLSGQKWPDGALVTAPPAPEIYIVQGGQRHWIPNPQTFIANGYAWDAVEAIPTSVINTIPLGAPVPAISRFIVDTGDVFLGAGHYMHTRPGLTVATGAIDVTTRPWT